MKRAQCRSAVCLRPCKSEIEEQILACTAGHRGVQVICYNISYFPNGNLSDYERYLTDNNVYKINGFVDDLMNLLVKMLHGIAKIIMVLIYPKSYHDAMGIRRFEDVKSVHVNAAGENRITLNQPVKHPCAIFSIGGCTTSGYGMSDNGTSASQFQRLLKELEPEQGFIIHNYGFCLCEIDNDPKEEFAILNGLPIRSGGILLWVHQQPDNATLFDFCDITLRLHNYGEVFLDLVECPSEHGYDFFKKLKKENFYCDYKEKLSVGTVGMKCNPFTNGHKYLIEQAASQCGYLIIFVVEEDKAIFPFQDSIEMVRKGTSGLTNVVVLSGRQCIISKLTFDEYFNKETLQERAIDPSLDAEIIAWEIAPMLHIIIRFAYEEPFDAVTRRYNDTMCVVLTKYGTHFEGIGCLAVDGEAANASRVRFLLKTGNVEATEKMGTSKHINIFERNDTELKKYLNNCMKPNFK